MVQVIESPSGFLFFGGEDGNDIVSQHTGKFDVSKILNQIRFCHISRGAFLKALCRGTYLHLISPNKETVASDLLAELLPREKFGLSPVSQYFAKFPDAMDQTFFFPSLLENFVSEKLYYYSDSHWTFKGAKKYFSAALRYVGQDDKALQLEQMPVKVDLLDFVGDLARHLGHSGEVQEHILPSPSYADNLFFNGISTEGRVFHFYNKKSTGRLLLMIDSTGSWLLNFAAELFEEVLAVHTADLDLNVLEAFRPDLLIFVQVERFFVRTPTNDSNWKSVISENEGKKGCSVSAIPYMHERGWL